MAWLCAASAGLEAGQCECVPLKHGLKTVGRERESRRSRPGQSRPEGKGPCALRARRWISRLLSCLALSRRPCNRRGRPVARHHRHRKWSEEREETRPRDYRQGTRSSSSVCLPTTSTEYRACSSLPAGERQGVSATLSSRASHAWATPFERREARGRARLASCPHALNGVGGERMKDAQTEVATGNGGAEAITTAVDEQTGRRNDATGSSGKDECGCEWSEAGVRSVERSTERRRLVEEVELGERAADDERGRTHAPLRPPHGHGEESGPASLEHTPRR